jgi:hypothetical protein
MKLPDRVFTNRPPANLAPKSVYYLPASDRAFSEDVQRWLRCHPLSYDLGGSDGEFARCPTCEQWTGQDGCDVRQLVQAGDLEAARDLHDEREWPAGTGKATTKFKGMAPDYRQVTFKHLVG